jgi:hypothetical protein
MWQPAATPDPSMPHSLRQFPLGCENKTSLTHRRRRAFRARSRFDKMRRYFFRLRFCQPMRFLQTPVLPRRFQIFRTAIPDRPHRAFENIDCCQEFLGMEPLL